jgi:cytochrome c
VQAPEESQIGHPDAVVGCCEYSPAMGAQSGVWEVERLDRFLQQPRSSVPGTSMAFPGVPEAEHRRALIEYLQRHGSIGKSCLPANRK